MDLRYRDVNKEEIYGMSGRTVVLTVEHQRRKDLISAAVCRHRSVSLTL
jgi:hypothetical protein